MSCRRPRFDNRITRLLGVDIPIANSPMGYIANPVLVAAVAEAGAIGLVPGSVTDVTADIRRVRELTDRPFGLNIPISFVREASIIDVIIGEGIRFVTTSAGPAARYTPVLKEAGVTVFHVVTSLESAKQAIDDGVDGLIVEGIEGAGLKGRTEVSTMVLLPLIASHVDVPVIVAGGIADGASMAAAFALGAEGVQMGTRMLASVEARVHENLKHAVIAASETDTVLINRHNGQPLRVLRSETSEALQFVTEGDPLREYLPAIGNTYRHGVLEGSIPSVGQVAGRIDSILPVAQIIARTIGEFGEVIEQLADSHLEEAPPPR